ncbi:MAG: SH3 domain-containing protein [Proteobacteria bacterium]|nr:SH3 domain-containing protein [Pseudomonadota bacterium]
MTTVYRDDLDPGAWGASAEQSTGAEPRSTASTQATGASGCAIPLSVAGALLLVVLAWLGSQKSVQPDARQREVIVPRVANVRSQPGIQYDVIGQLPRGCRILVIHEAAGWKRIGSVEWCPEIDGRPLGWIRGDLSEPVE